MLSQKTAFLTSILCLATRPPYESRNGHPGEKAIIKVDLISPKKEEEDISLFRPQNSNLESELPKNNYRKEERRREISGLGLFPTMALCTSCNDSTVIILHFIFQLSSFYKYFALTIFYQMETNGPYDYDTYLLPI